MLLLANAKAKLRSPKFGNELKVKFVGRGVKTVYSGLNLRLEFEIMSEKPNEDEDFEFKWIQSRKDAGLASYDSEETGGGKFLRKFKENPFVPLGKVI